MPRSESFSSISPLVIPKAFEKKSGGEKSDQGREPGRPGEQAQDERQGDPDDIPKGNGDPSQAHVLGRMPGTGGVCV